MKRIYSQIQDKVFIDQAIHILTFFYKVFALNLKIQDQATCSLLPKSVFCGISNQKEFNIVEEKNIALKVKE